MLRVLDGAEDKSVTLVKQRLLQEAEKIIEEDRQSCRKVGRYGAKLFKNNDTVLTICNAGILATIDPTTRINYKQIATGAFDIADEALRQRDQASESKP